jgi:uncharacterized protein
MLAALYLCACLAFYFLNDHGLFPGRGTHGLLQAMVPPSPGYKLVHFNTAHGDPIVAIFGRALDGGDHVLSEAASRPTVLYFYGNAISMANCFNEFRGFRRLGLNVMIPDYPGYGMSGGSASERSFYACGDAAFEQLLHRPDVDPRQIASVGWSLGAAVATDVAAHRPVMCLATFSAFTSWKDQTGSHHFWLPTAWLLSARFDNAAKFSTLRCPVLIAHGRQDEIIPFTNCERLATARGGVVPLVLNSKTG